jgi:RND family efflux transporter MFP subunit
MQIRVPPLSLVEGQVRSTSKPAGRLAVLLFLGLAACGCDGPAPKPAAPPVQEVEVGLPVTRQIVDYVDFTGRTEAMKSIDVRARVSGYLEKVLFREGHDVQEGDVLFLIDPRTYQADYDRAIANLAQAKAHLDRVEADYQRAETLIKTATISKSDYDLALGNRQEAAALVHVAEAAVNTAKLNLDFTRVTAPISGQISRQNIDPGNLVMADNTILTTVISLDPIYAYFDVDEGTTLRFRRLLEAGKVKSARDVKSPVFLGLADEEQKFPHEGTINFVDNRLDPFTGTLCLRGMFDNHARFLAPGMFVRIRVPIGQVHPAILAAERAIGSDQGQKFLYVLNDKNQVVYREVQTGAYQDGLRVIESGLAPNERFIINGLQRVQAGDTVQPTLVQYPSPGEGEGKAKAVVIQDRGHAPALAHDSPRLPGDGPGEGRARAAGSLLQSPSQSPPPRSDSRLGIGSKYVEQHPTALPKDIIFKGGDGRGGGKLR